MSIRAASTVGNVRAGRDHLAGALVLAIVVAALGALFDRTWRHGEVFSPADLVQTFYPWAYDGPRIDPTNPTRSDEAFYHQPLMVTHWARLRQGDFPQWDPWTLAGAPAFHHGLDVGRAFSPLSMPFYLLPPDIAVTVYAPLRLLVAAWLMWLYLRHARMAPVACAVGAVAFALNGAFLVWLSAPMPTVALWLPLVALGIERIVSSGRARDVAILSLGIGLQWLGAYLPTSLVVMAVASVWAAGWLFLAAPGTGPAGFDRAARIAGGLLLGSALGAVAAGPMLAALVDSAASARSMRAFTQPWQNLATFALPDFWGSPLSRNWWYPGDGNYPELVTYLGVATLALAGAGATTSVATRDRRGLLALGMAAFALMQMYGWPPVAWTSALPGLRQMNPHRWNVALAFSVAILAALGLDRLAAGRQRRAWALAGAVGILLALATVAAAALATELDVIRRLGLQVFERAQIARFVVVSSAALVLAAGASSRKDGLRRVASWALIALVAAELTQAAYGFNPTVPRNRLYQTAPAIDFLRREIGADRVAPIGTSAEFAEGHLWGLFRIPSVTGFDFFGDARYQAFLARAAGLPAGAPRWAHIGLAPTPRPDLALLGLLGVRLIVTAPVDVSTNDRGYTTVGELTDGRTVAQAFQAGSDGLHRVDVLAATFARPNEGTLELSLVAEADGAVVATRRVAAADLRDLDWITLEFPARKQSAGHRFRLEVLARGGRPGASATVMATDGQVPDGLPAGRLVLDGVPDPRALWIRTFASAPDRFPGATQVYARDLNVYRNPETRPLAWFVTEVDVVAPDEALNRLTAPGFDPARVAIVERPVDGASGSASARVRRLDSPDPDRRTVEVDAPAGGVLVFRERFHPGWSLRAESGPIPLVRADSVLMAAAIPPGTRHLELIFTTPAFPLSLLASALALAGTGIAFFRRRPSAAQESGARS